MIVSPELDTYWITFPNDPNLPLGIGVTAYSAADAFKLIVEQGIDAWLANASKLLVVKGIRFQYLDQRNFSPNVGPMQFRGGWYPAMNIGWGAPKRAQYRPL